MSGKREENLQTGRERREKLAAQIRYGLVKYKVILKPPPGLETVPLTEKAIRNSIAGRTDFDDPEKMGLEHLLMKTGWSRRIPVHFRINGRLFLKTISSTTSQSLEAIMDCFGNHLILPVRIDEDDEKTNAWARPFFIRELPGMLNTSDLRYVFTRNNSKGNKTRIDLPNLKQRYYPFEGKATLVEPIKPIPDTLVDILKKENQ